MFIYFSEDITIVDAELSTVDITPPDNEGSPSY